ncbi:MAG: hypothetical protein JST22_20045 [Bacteroidetes bacterium]|nr:hypothetical protein [Bacteroidota bacterium]
MGRLLDLLFPVGDPQRKRRTSELIELGLRALRDARDARAVTTGGATLVPSRLELRLAQIRFDELTEIGATRDVEYYFNDELMKDLKARRMRTFGDQPVYITVGIDRALQANELQAVVLSPAQAEPERMPAGTSEVFDRTTVMGHDGVPLAPAAPRPVLRCRLVVRSANGVREVPLEGTHWILGRRGASGRPAPQGYTKVDLDLPPTVSREQARVDLVGGDRLRIERIGKAPMHLGAEAIGEGENRLALLGAAFTIEDCELMIVADAAQRG